MVATPGFLLLVRSYEEQVLEQLDVQSKMVFQTLSIMKVLPEQDPVVEKLYSQSPFRLTLIRQDGKVLYDNRKPANELENHLFRPEIQHLLRGEPAFSRRFSDSLNQDMLYFARMGPEFTSSRGKNRIFIRLAQPLKTMKSDLMPYLYKILGMTLLIALMAGVLSVHISRKLTSPLKELGNKASSFASSFIENRAYDGEMLLKRPVFDGTQFKTMELYQLSETMNHMADRIVLEMEDQRNQFQRHQVILKSMVEGVISVDMTGHIQSINQAAAAMFRMNKCTELNGTAIHLFLRHPKVLEALDDVLKTGNPGTRELELSTPGFRFLEIRIMPLMGSDNTQIGAVLVGQDLTGAKALAKMRKDFVANVSHELKTPITAIKGFVETLLVEEGLASGERKQFLSIILKHADRMTAIVEDLLSLSRLERNRDSFEFSELIPRTVIDEAISDCMKEANKKHIDIAVIDHSHAKVKANALLLERAVVNLLENAIKYSAGGTNVFIRISEKKGCVHIEIEDQGEGISTMYHHRIFERFFRVDKARSKKAGGTGLGLSIVKHIAELHSGKVLIHSSRGKGSTFTLVIPVLSKNQGTLSSSCPDQPEVSF